MAITSWPYVAQDTTDIEYGRLFRESVDDGVAGGIGTNALEPFGDSSGMNVKMRAGSAVARGYMMYSTAQETVAVGAAHATLQRIDRLVLELNLSAATVAQRILPKIVAGVAAAAGQAVPTALIQTETGIYQIPVARITVDAAVNSIAASKVVDDRDWIGQTVGMWRSSSKRPANARKYKLGFNEEIGGFEWFDGANWKSLNDHSHALTDSTITGVLPLNKGGTGATNKSAARAALGIFVQSDAPSNPGVDDVWIKKS